MTATRRLAVVQLNKSHRDDKQSFFTPIKNITSTLKWAGERKGLINHALQTHSPYLDSASGGHQTPALEQHDEHWKGILQIFSDQNSVSRR